MNTRQFDFVFKVVIIGDSFVGKTTMLQNYIGNKEVGVQRHLAEKNFYRNGHRVKLQIFDTMGTVLYFFCSGFTDFRRVKLYCNVVMID